MGVYLPKLKHSELPLPLLEKAGRTIAVASRTKPRVAKKMKKEETILLFFGLGRQAAHL